MKRFDGPAVFVLERSDVHASLLRFHEKRETNLDAASLLASWVQIFRNVKAQLRHFLREEPDFCRMSQEAPRFFFARRKYLFSFDFLNLADPQAEFQIF